MVGAVTVVVPAWVRKACEMSRASQGENSILRATAVLDNPGIPVVLAIWPDCIVGFRDRCSNEDASVLTAWECAEIAYELIQDATRLAYEDAYALLAMIRAAGVAFPDGVVTEHALTACRTIAVRRLKA